MKRNALFPSIPPEAVEFLTVECTYSWIARFPDFHSKFEYIFLRFMSCVGYFFAGNPPRAECRVLAEWCVNCNCRRRDATVSSMMVIAGHKWGSNVTGGTCMPWEPEGSPYLSTYLPTGTLPRLVTRDSTSHLNGPHDG